ncbi:MAG TPA: hypothetical protein VMZ28_24015 [Kofleriaceae bacterium]|nr:hypothetical protein [Kofleriaceae bacterium]
MPRFRTLGLLVALAPACGGASNQYHVARGAHGELPYHSEGCRTDSSAHVAVKDGRFFEAVAPGRARVECADDSYVLDVEEVARVELRRWPALEADHAGFVSLSLFAYDQDGRELYLGNFVDVAWQIPATLEQRSGCHGDILPSCDPGYTIAVRANGAGDHRVVAGFAGREASIDLDGPAARAPR